MTASAGLAGQTALVTGTAAGIGRAIALRLAAAGAHVILADRDEAGLEETHALIIEAGGTSRIAAIDLADAAALPAYVAAVLAQNGRIDILVNCAGVVGQSVGLLASELDDWNFVFSVNVTAPFVLMREVARNMVERGQGGRIVNVTSSSAHRALMSMPAYGASKSALMQLTRSAAAQLGPHNINVNAVAPGLTNTSILSSRFSEEQVSAMVTEGVLANLLHRVSEPQDVAETVLFLCLPASRQITAQTIHVSGGAVIAS